MPSIHNKLPDRFRDHEDHRSFHDDLFNFRDTPAPESPESYTLSTAYATKSYTITICAPTVTNCPVGKVTTKTESLYTTYYPVIEVASTPAPATAPFQETTTVQVSSVTFSKPAGLSFQPPLAFSSARVTTVEVSPVPIMSSEAAGEAPVASSFSVVSASVRIVTSIGTSTGAVTSSLAQTTANGASLVGVRWMGTGLMAVLAGILLL